jgi:hypothetical protein
MNKDFHPKELVGCGKIGKLGNPSQSSSLLTRSYGFKRSSQAVYWLGILRLTEPKA